MYPVISEPPPAYDDIFPFGNPVYDAGVEPAPTLTSRVDYGEDPLLTACRNNDRDFLIACGRLSEGIDYLYTNKGKKSQYDDKISLLHACCYENQPEVLALLLEWGADPNITLPASGLTPIEVACAEGHPEIVSILAEYLFPHRLDVNAIHHVTSPAYPADFTLLQLACRWQNAQVIKTLLANNADPNLVAPGWGLPPLHLACAKTVDGEIVSSLLEAKACVNTRHRKSTALHVLCSAEQSSEEALRVLLAGKADINAVTSKGLTPLMLAAQNNAQLAQLLLAEEGVDATKTDCQGWQAIHYAAQSGFDDVINELTNKGAEPDARTDKGVTPLHLAVLGKKEPAIYALLEHGADPSIKAPVTGYSWAKTCEFTLLLFCSVLCCPISIYALCISGGCDEFWRDKPIHERCVRMCGQTCCPACCGLSPLELADEGLQERMTSRVITNQPGAH